VKSRFDYCFSFDDSFDDRVKARSGNYFGVKNYQVDALFRNCFDASYHRVESQIRSCFIASSRRVN
jgi:hypothetical protein